MSTAVLISGQLRTFATCYPTIRWHLLRHYPDLHFFIAVEDNAQVASLDLLRRDYGADHVHVQLLVDPDLSADLTPALGAAYHLAPYANAAPAHQLLLQHWYQNEVWKFFVRENSFGGETPMGFDTIIRLRADLWFHGFDPAIEVDFPHSRECPLPHECFTPWWGRFGGVNDRLAVMNCHAAEYYFTVYRHIPELLAAGCPFHPESLLLAALDRGDVHHRPTLRAEFSTRRLPGDPRGEFRPWLQEVLPCDVCPAA